MYKIWGYAPQEKGQYVRTTHTSRWEGNVKRSERCYVRLQTDRTGSGYGPLKLTLQDRVITFRLHKTSEFGDQMSDHQPFERDYAHGVTYNKATGKKNVSPWKARMTTLDVSH